MAHPAAHPETGTETLPVDIAGGLCLHVDGHDSLGLRTRGGYEPYETGLLLALIAPGSVVLDVGANIGYHTGQFARAAGGAGHVFAFEPDPDNLGILRRNVAVNDCRNVTVVPKAAADRCARARLFRSADNNGDHRVYDSGDGRGAIAIDAVAIDDELSGVEGPISLVKLDIQGAEPAAVRGMRRLLDRHPEAWVATELWPLGLERSGSSVGEYLELLRSLGGALLRVDERRRCLQPLDMRWLAETVTVDRGNHTNLLIPRRDWVRRDTC